ncbi:MAG TPA: enoyl-CoA hydratase [Candidatus Angelobacter sp.]|jgi:2-(1,2-epoxy-1,2-dihydrophenyl)acetyl-CoA isomerase|nr:enoyl-CoA hydratase [Candidatus Angelobacter sp.]
MKNLLTKQEGGIYEITLNRPESRNALNAEMRNDLVAALDEIAGSATIRCLVLKAAGPGFMAGGDVKFFHQTISHSADERRKFFKEFVEGIHPFVTKMTNLPVPIVASVHGAVAGFGVSLTMLCDFVVAADDSFFTLAYIHLGTTPDGSSTYFLPRLVGLRRAKEIAFLGDRIPAQEAAALGLVNKVVPLAELETATAALAVRLANGPTKAYARTRALLNSAFDRSFDEQLEQEAVNFSECAATEDFADGVNAFVERRKPVFKGR